MSNIGSYEKRRQGFDWSIAKRELGYEEGRPLNIGWYCSDRICELGKGGKQALLWESHSGESRSYTFDDLRVLTNTFAAFVRDLVIAPGERVRQYSWRRQLQLDC